MSDTIQDESPVRKRPRMKNLPIYEKILRVATRRKRGVTIPELRQAIPFLDDLTNERLYQGYVKPCLEHGWLKRVRWHMRKLGGHEFVFKGLAGYVSGGTDLSKMDGIGPAGTIYKITAQGRIRAKES